MPGQSCLFSSLVSTGIPRISRQSRWNIIQYCSISLIDSACCCACNLSCLTESFSRVFNFESYCCPRGLLYLALRKLIEDVISQALYSKGKVVVLLPTGPQGESTEATKFLI